jgi:hypothetical protein
VPPRRLHKWKLNIATNNIRNQSTYCLC